MAEIVTMPKLGFDMAEGTLVRWVIAEGEAVKKGTVLAEIETDKATVEVESAFDGIVIRQLVSQGTVVPVNSPIAVVGAPGEEVNVEALVGGVPEAKSPPKEAPAKGTVPEPSAPQPASATTPESSTSQPVSEAVPDAQASAGYRASPLARRLAEERGIALGELTGTGPGGRITRRDVEAYKEPPVAGPQTIQPAVPSALPVLSPAAGLPVEDRVIPLTRLRATIARRMSESNQQIPHFFVTHVYAMDAVMDLRKQMNLLLPEEEKLSVNDFVIRAVALALTEFPNLNASIDPGKEQLIHHGHVNVGAAVAVPNGLLTVVCQDTPLKSIRQISREMQTMVNRAREGKVRPDDIEGSTFTISNLGMFDVDQFTAIINSPEAAILAVGSAQQVPVVVDGEIRVGIRMKATLSVDHRISDGVEAAQFMQSLARYLEAPLRLLM